MNGKLPFIPRAEVQKTFGSVKHFHSIFLFTDDEIRLG